MKNLPILFLLLLAIATLPRCSSPSENALLVAADSLLQKNELDSAGQILSVMRNSLTSEQERAYWQLLQTIYLYKTEAANISDSTLQFPIQYYQRSRDKRKLALAQIYKGTIQLMEKNFADAAATLKESEKTAIESDDEEAIIRALVMIGLLNTETGNYSAALDYTRKSLAVATLNNNKRWMGHVYSMLSVIFEKISMQDSSRYYSKLSADYIQYLPVVDQPLLLNNLAIEKIYQQKYEEAESLLRKSLEMKPLLETHGRLAQLYTTQGRIEEAGNLWQDVLKIPDQTQKVQFLYNYSEWLQQQGRFQEACQVEKQRGLIMDTLSRERQAEAVKGVQVEFDHKQKVIFWQSWAIGGLVFFLILTIVASVLAIRNRQRRQDNMKQLADQQQLISTYEKQLEEHRQELEGHRKDLEENREELGKHEKMVVELERKVKTLRDEQNRLLTVGKVNYEHILSGGSAAKWRKRDFESFMEYFRTVNPEYVINLDRIYSSLTPQMKVFLSVQKLGKTEEEARGIMGLSPVAYRKMKSRIREKKSQVAVLE